MRRAVVAVVGALVLWLAAPAGAVVVAEYECERWLCPDTELPVSAVDPAAARPPEGSEDRGSDTPEVADSAD